MKSSLWKRNHVRGSECFCSFCYELLSCSIVDAIERLLFIKTVFVSVIIFMEVFNLIFGFQLMVARCGRGFAKSNVGL